MNKLIYFYSQTCSPCHQMAPIVNQIRLSGIPIEYVDTANDNGVISKTRKFNIKSVPTIVKIDSRGNELGRLVGFNTFGRINDFYKQG